MNGVCRLSHRWHQQFCQSPSFGPHKNCLQSLVLTRSYRSRSGTNRIKNERSINADTINQDDHLQRLLPRQSRLFPRNDIVVREFEQHGSDARTRRRIQPDAALQEETAEVWSQIQKLEQQLAVLKQGPFGPQSKFMQSLPENEREQLLQALADEGVFADQESDEMDLAEIDRMIEEDNDNTEQTQSRLGVTLRIPRVEREYVQRFNKALRAAEEGKGDILKNLSLWKWYLRTQQRVSNFSKIISERVWQFLWQSQSELAMRPKHIIMLAKDMNDAGQDLQDEQVLEYVRSLHAVEDTSTALIVWEEYKPRFKRAPQDILSNFYSIGIQLYRSLGRPLKAQETLREGRAKGVDPKILVHMISAWADDKSSDSGAKAWAAYEEMKMALGSTIGSDIYETVSNSFLDAGRTEMALAVFRELVVHSKGGQNPSAAQKQFLQYVDMKRDPEDIENAINEISLASLLVLPREYHNKYFFASWIKKLIGAKRVDSAAMVVDLMFERNIIPDAIHLNGIIGAWFRQGKPESRIKAEKLAGDMIQARINMVQQRSRNLSSKEFGMAFRKVMPMQELNNTWNNPIHITRPMCAANAETFAILLDHYEHRTQPSEFDRIISLMFGPAQLQPNIVIMNKVLRISTKDRTLAKFWNVYNITKKQMRLNFDTFSLAWLACALHFAPVTAADKGPRNLYPSSRKMFGDMMTWFNGLERRDSKQAKEELSSDLYAQIINCFCYQMDLPGTVCAIRGLYDVFGAAPGDRAVQLITGQVSRFLSSSQAPHRRGGRSRPNDSSSGSQSLLREVADIVDTLEAKHKFDLVESGEATPEEVESPHGHVSQKIKVEVLTELLIMMTQKTQREGADHIQTLGSVATVMQVDISKIKSNLSSQ